MPRSSASWQAKASRAQRRRRATAKPGTTPRIARLTARLSNYRVAISQETRIHELAICYRVFASLGWTELIFPGIAEALDLVIATPDKAQRMLGPKVREPVRLQ
ncbi:hypothethical protein [Ralstonia solanacearum PSI07]|nr:hypothethical protein [Ralstonia solanacearum PSI07]